MAERRQSELKRGRVPVELTAGLNIRRKMVMRYYGGTMAFSRHFGIPYNTVQSWKKIPAKVAAMVHKDRRGPGQITASFCRPDLQLDKDGNIKRKVKRRVYT